MPDTEQILDADIVLIAASFWGSQKYITDAFKVELNAHTNVKTEDESIRQTLIKYLLQAICTEVNHLSWGHKRKAEKQQEKLMRV